MTLLDVILALVILGLVLFLVSKLPLEPPVIKTVIYVVVILALLLWVAGAFPAGGFLHRPLWR